jgi:hypothetical protein
MSLSLAYEDQELEPPGPLELPPRDESLDELIPLPIDS